MIALNLEKKLTGDKRILLLRFFSVFFRESSFENPLFAFQILTD
jgi:hypothetical protein